MQGVHTKSGEPSGTFSGHGLGPTMELALIFNSGFGALFLPESRQGGAQRGNHGR